MKTNKNPSKKSTLSPIEQLHLFVEKIDRLLTSRFTRDTVSQKIEWQFSWSVEKGGILDYSGCDIEARDAFLLTFRMFIQNNDTLSVANISGLMDSLKLPETITAPWKDCREKLNIFLDSRVPFTAFDQSTSYRNLLYTLLYADLSHVDPSYRPALVLWMKDPLTWSLIRTLFLSTLANVLMFLSVLKVLAQMAIVELEKGPSMQAQIQTV